MKRFIRAAAIAALVVTTNAAAFAAGDDVKNPTAQGWSWDGIFGKFDRAQLQRGFQVYKEVCAACHELRYVSFRNLTEVGFSEAQSKAIAASYEVIDGPNDEGEMFKRPGRLADRIPAPFANEKAARAANNGAAPPNLSLITKARHDGSNYVFSLVSGYEKPPASMKVAEGMNYNPYFPGHQIAMAPPLEDGKVQFADSTAATVKQMASDVTAFLTWAAEPGLEARKRLGFKVMIFLLVLTALFIAAKQKVWRDLH
ncbi:MAG: cytochrome c1 [Alphaproteobacteria bacterium]|nr:cytochrome c1 [Alphaproteobacteria bacterium]